MQLLIQPTCREVGSVESHCIGIHSGLTGNLAANWIIAL